MFGEKSQEEIQEIYNNTTSRIIIKLITSAAQEQLKLLESSQNNDPPGSRDTFVEKRNAFFSAASVVEQECWESTEFTESYRYIIRNLAYEKTLPEAISILKSWIQSAKDNGF